MDNPDWLCIQDDSEVEHQTFLVGKDKWLDRCQFCTDCLVRMGMERKDSGVVLLLLYERRNYFKIYLNRSNVKVILRLIVHCTNGSPT